MHARRSIGVHPLRVAKEILTCVSKSNNNIFSLEIKPGPQVLHGVTEFPKTLSGNGTCFIAGCMDSARLPTVSRYVFATADLGRVAIGNGAYKRVGPFTGFQESDQ